MPSSPMRGGVEVRTTTDGDARIGVPVGPQVSNQIFCWHAASAVFPHQQHHHGKSHSRFWSQELSLACWPALAPASWLHDGSAVELAA